MKLRAVLALTLFAAACGSDGGDAKPDAAVAVDAAVTPDSPATPDAPPDAPPVNYDFSCMGNSAPTTADATVTIGGTVQEVVVQGTSPSIQPAAGVNLRFCKGNCMGQNELDTDGPTTNTGAFMSAAIQTGGMPLDGYVRATKQGNLPAVVVPPSPITTNLADAPVLMISEQAVALLGLVGINQNPQNGIVALLVTDCANMPINGAVANVTQNGQPVGEVVDASQFDPMLAGAFLVFNVPPGVTSTGATFNNMPLRAHDVTAETGTLTSTQVRPGF